MAAAFPLMLHGSAWEAWLAVCGMLHGRGGRLAAPNYEGWSCPYGQSRFGAVTEVWGEEQEEWMIGGWEKEKGSALEIRVEI